MANFKASGCNYLGGRPPRLCYCPFSGRHHPRIIHWAWHFCFSKIFRCGHGGRIRTGGAAAAVYWSLLVLAIVNIGREVLNGTHNFLTDILLERLNGQLNLRIHAKAARMEPIAFETGEFLDDINKAKEGPKTA